MSARVLDLFAFLTEEVWTNIDPETEQDAEFLTEMRDDEFALSNIEQHLTYEEDLMATFNSLTANEKTDLLRRLRESWSRDGEIVCSSSCYVVPVSSTEG